MLWQPHSDKEYDMSEQFAGKTALATGGGTGIGQAAALGLGSTAAPYCGWTRRDDVETDRGVARGGRWVRTVCRL